MKKSYMSAEMVSQKIRSRGGQWKGKGGDIPNPTRTMGNPNRAVLIPTGMLQSVVRGVK